MWKHMLPSHTDVSLEWYNAAIMNFERIDLSQTDTAVAAARAAATLAAGGIVIYPTETVYGVGVDATNQAAIDRVLQYKSRREGKPLSVAVTDGTMADRYVHRNEQARSLYKRFLPGPITVVSKSRGVVANGVASEFDTLGIRIPDHELILEIARQFDGGFTATSANASGKKRPYSVEDILEELTPAQIDMIDLILDAGTLPPNEPSSVIDTTLSTPVTVRSGSIGKKLFPDSNDTLTLTSTSPTETRTIAGRQLLQHWDALKTRGLVIGLTGPLGAGKTEFTKGAADFLQIEATITSPTYSYHLEYDFKRHDVPGTLHHLDLWKIDDPAVVERLDLSSLIGPRQVTIVEWWQQGASVLREKIEALETAPVFLAVDIAPDTEDDTRAITITSHD